MKIEILGRNTLNTMIPAFDSIELGMLLDQYEEAAAVKVSAGRKNTEAIDQWVANQGKMSNGKKALIVVLCLFTFMVGIMTAMVRNAEAGTAFMRFTVFSVTEETIIVVDEHEDFFTFYKEGTPEVHKGDVVIVCTDITYKGNDQWEWNRGRTAIIEVKD